MNVEEFMPNDLDVQKAVVESLAADKVVQDEKIESMGSENNSLRSENIALKIEIEKLKTQIESMKQALTNIGDVLSKNTESTGSNNVALLDRNPNLSDKFIGETRDHVLEVIKEAYDIAEKKGRFRRAQILESVLVENEPIGNLIKKRLALEKFFSDNGNILSGVVIEELEKAGIPYKNGEDYLLVTDILKRTY